jgi:hypothetical protein
MPGGPRPAPHVAYQQLEGELVLVNLRTNRIYALNATGARLWELLHAGYDAPDIRRQLGEEFDVDPTRLEREMDAAFESLASEGLIVYGDE